jgi:hypothetical protein
MRSGYGSVLEGIPFHLAFPGGVGPSERGSVASVADSERTVESAPTGAQPQSRLAGSDPARRGSVDSLAAAAEIASRFE